MDMYTFLCDMLEKRAKQFEKGMRDTRSSLRHLKMRKDTDRVRFYVRLYDGWPDEKEVEIRSRRSLEQAIKDATARYRKINKRSDVQARCSVAAAVPAPGGSARVELPKSMWGAYFEQYSQAPAPIPKGNGGSIFDG